MWQENKLNSSRDLIPLLLILLTLAVYLPAITWGIPHPTGPDFTHAWGNDDQIPLAPLAEMHNTFFNAKPDRNVAYPWFHYFLVACAYGPYLFYLLWSGGVSNLESVYPVYPFGIADPTSTFLHLSLIGRSVTLLLALATVLGAYYTGKHLWGRKAGFLSAIFTMLMFPMAYYARIGNLDVPVLGWTSLGLAILALILRQGLTVKRGVWFGAFVALAMSTKDQALGSFFLLILALLWLHIRAGKVHRLWRWTSIWSAPFATAVSFIMTYVLASGILIDPVRYSQHAIKVLTVGTRLTLELSYLRYPATLSGFAAQAGDLFGYLIDVMSWPVLIAAGVGILIAIRRDRLSLVLALSSIGFFVMLLPVRLSRLHHLIPIALPLSVFAAYAFSQGLECGRRIRVITAIVAIGVSGYLLLQTVDLTHDMLFDSRYTASAWLDKRTQPGDSLLYFGAGLTVPPLRPDIKTMAVRNRRFALSTILEGKPDYVLIMPLDFNEDRHRVEWRRGPYSIYSDYLPADVYARLVDGSLGYRLAAQFQTPRLFPWLNRPFLSYPTVNPPIHIYARIDRAQGMARLKPWETAPHYPQFIRVRELTIDRIRTNNQ
jgi:hypothetical protein